MRPGKRCLGLTAVVLTAAMLALLIANRPATADFGDKSVSALSKFITSGAAVNLRLCAMDALRKKTSTGNAEPSLRRCRVAIRPVSDTPVSKSNLVVSASRVWSGLMSCGPIRNSSERV